jgi:hypothetical protein
MHNDCENRFKAATQYRFLLNLRYMCCFVFFQCSSSVSEWQYDTFSLPEMALRLDWQERSLALEAEESQTWSSTRAQHKSASNPLQINLLFESFPLVC